jgi:hypothetical protein
VAFLPSNPIKLINTSMGQILRAATIFALVVGMGNISMGNIGMGEIGVGLFHRLGAPQAQSKLMFSYISLHCCIVGCQLGIKNPMQDE